MFRTTEKEMKPWIEIVSLHPGTDITAWMSSAAMLTWVVMNTCQKDSWDGSGRRKKAGRRAVQKWVCL
jgi:hypothetical protein